MLLIFPAKGTTAGPTYSSIVRLAAQYDMFPGEFSTQNEPSASAGGGQLIYDTVVYPPTAANVLYVTVSGTGDAHSSAPSRPAGASQPQGQAKILLACLVNNAPCNSGGGDENGAPTGWVTLQFPVDDLHDNGITYQWCKAIPTGGAPRHVTVKMASSNGEDVFMEQTHFFVDASQLAPHSCDQAATPEGAGGGPPVGPSNGGHNG
jgi:hypothetical protein